MAPSERLKLAIDVLKHIAAAKALDKAREAAANALKKLETE